MAKELKDGKLDVSDEPEHFPVLGKWDSAVLTERLTAAVEADGREPNYEQIRGFAAILESDLESCFGYYPEKRKRKAKA